ncbi:MAG: peptidoglycan DD-metalloendopeptidase family protein [Bacteroidales bacterium]|nr:peptidoglycan DD-metalloendopeptidase family protein [Bacteroidales bacterium]
MNLILIKILKNLTTTIIISSFIIFIGNISYAQKDKQKLQANKNKIENEIKYTNKLLEETKKSKQTSVNQLVILNNKINNREKLIKTINTELNNLNKQIELNNTIVKELTNDLKNLKDEYAKMIYYAFKNKNAYDRLMFLFASDDFNQAFKRLKYLQQYSTYRKKQVELILKTQKELNQNIEKLESHKTEKTALLQSKEKEKNQLTKEKNEKDNTIKQLTQKEKKLLKTLKEKEKAAIKLQNAIEAIIAEEIRFAAERAKKTGMKTKTTIFALTPEEKKLSETFATNKGSLPWPSERGIITSSFGEHAHPVLKGIKIKNNGIDILTEKGSKARAIFGGTVTRVLTIPNYNYVVMIRHGEYLSVYSNLDEVYVRKGDIISIKQDIGLVHTSQDESKTELHFELWKGKTLLNPASWLAQKR